MLRSLVGSEMCIRDRSLAGSSLAMLSVLDPEYTLQIMVPTLLKNATLQNVGSRHGSLVALAALLTKWQTDPPPADVLPGVLLDCTKVLLTVYKKKLVRGSGGEATRIASCQLTKAVFALLDSEGEPVVAPLVELPAKQGILANLLDCIDVGAEALHGPVAEAVGALVGDLSDEFQSHLDEVLARVMDAKLGDKSAKNTTQRAGYMLVLGSLPDRVYTRRWYRPILECGMEFVSMKAEKAPEVRQNAVRTLHSLVLHSIARSELVADDWTPVFNKLVLALGDYSKDNRGQVGSWVRIEAINALRDLAPKVSASFPELWTSPMCTKLLSCTLRLSLEHLDKVRTLALSTLHYFVSSSLPQLPHLSLLQSVCTDSICTGGALHCFEQLVALTSLPALCKPVVLGLCDSIGAPGKYTSEAAITALRGYLSTHPEAQLAVMVSLVKLINEKKGKASLTSTLVKALHSMLCADMFTAVTADEPVLMEGVEELVLVCERHAGELPLIVAAMSSTASMLMLEPDEEGDAAKLVGLPRRCVEVVIRLGLGHNFPRVRSVTADALYNALQVRDDLWEDEIVEEVQDLLLETKWEADLMQLQQPLQQLEALTLG
eukprot:TRINITY_DN5773_c0_g1_i1.p1 TRINITY_DN5773_c0_g1~~TRINITY_DN5773_c0_g1_i1.p1  ORF type:complete len:604 (+),score=167.76 TRINITY_DN5773_c0_g1_i1:86-1897(+)